MSSGWNRLDVIEDPLPFGRVEQEVDALLAAVQERLVLYARAEPVLKELLGDEEFVDRLSNLPRIQSWLATPCLIRSIEPLDKRSTSNQAGLVCLEVSNRVGPNLVNESMNHRMMIHDRSVSRPVNLNLASTRGTNCTTSPH